jgi:hypothetical protein
MLSYSQAESELFAHFKTKWENESGTIIGYIPQILWPNIENDLLDISKFYVHLINPHFAERKTYKDLEIKG